MKYLLDLSKEEAILIQGGGAYELGKAIGGWCADVYDFWSAVGRQVFK